MTAPLPLRVPSRLRNAPRLADLAQVPGNVIALPGAAADPVPQGNRPGRHPEWVKSLHKARLAKAEREAARRALLDELNTEVRLLGDLTAMVRRLRWRIAVTRQALNRLDVCTPGGKAVQQ